MIANQTRFRIKLVMLFFIVALIIAGAGTYFYFFRYKEPTHGVFVYNSDNTTREGVVSGCLYKPS